MQEVARADLFFMITSFVVLFIGALVVVLVVYVIKVIHDISKITSVVKEESILLKEDIDDARKEFKARGLNGLGWFSIIKAVFTRATKGRKTKKK